MDKISDILLNLNRGYQEYPYLLFKPNRGFQEDFLNSRSRFRVVFAGNRSGKSKVSAYEVVRFALGLREGVEVPNEGWVVSPDSRVAFVVMIPYVKQFLGNQVKKFYKREQILEVKNGSVIYFKSTDSGVEKFTGASIRYCAIDEDVPEEIFREIVMRTVDKKGDLWITITPLYSTWMYEKIYLRQFTDPELQVFQGSTYENASNLPEGEIERLKTLYSPEELQARLYGKFLFLEGLVYKEFSLNQHCVMPFHISDDWIRLRFIDVGIKDPTACIWVAINKEDKYFVYREYYETEKTIEENAKNIILLTGNEKIVRTYIDPSSDRRGAQSHITDYRAYIEAGIKPLFKAPLVEKMTMINAVKTMLKNKRLFIFRNLRNTLTEFSTYSYKKSGIPEDKNDHILSCIGWLCCLNLRYEHFTNAIPQYVPKEKNSLYIYE
jgi:phage terminase large subunit-like protein